MLRGSRSLLRHWSPVVVFEHGLGDATDALWAELKSSGLGVYELDAWLSTDAPLTNEGFRETLTKGAYYFLAASPTWSRSL